MLVVIEPWEITIGIFLCIYEQKKCNLTYGDIIRLIIVGINYEKLRFLRLIR